MSRLVHFVGSLPPAVNGDPRSGLEWIVGRAGDATLTTLPRDVEERWIADFIVALGEREAFDVVRPGRLADYDDQPIYRVKSGVKLAAEHVDMNRRDTLRATIAAYRELIAERPELAAVKHQVSLPAPLDLSMFTFGKSPTLLTGVRAYSAALAAEVADLQSSDSDVLVWQLETPSVLILLNTVPSALRTIVARKLARELGKFIARLPRDTELVLHLCYGNLGDREYLTPSSMKGVDVFLNTLRAALTKQGRDVPPVHIPSAYGSHPPFTAAEFYSELSRVHRDWRLIAGVADENNPETSARALEVFETAAGRPAYAVATACGLARHSADDAGRAAALMVELAGS